MSEASSPTSKELNLTRECEVCTAPAPDHLHFGGEVALSSSLQLTVLSPSTLLLLLPGLLQAESHQEGGTEVQDQSRGLSARHQRQEVHRLQIPEMSQVHRSSLSFWFIYRFIIHYSWRFMFLFCVLHIERL